MLVEFRVANFRSFKDEQTLSLVASGRDKTHPENVISREGFDLLKAAGIYGANASGKSNLVKAIAAMERFVRISATKMNQGDPIPGIVPFRLDQDTPAQPSSFEVTVLLDGTRYDYGFAATSRCVHEEWLTAYPPPHHRPQRWLERHRDPETGQEQWAFRQALSGPAKMLQEQTRDNCLALSRGAQLNVPSLTNLYLWFRKNLWLFFLSDSTFDLMERTTERIARDEGLHQRVLSLVRDADLGIRGLRVSEETLKLPDFAARPAETPEEAELLKDWDRLVQKAAKLGKVRTVALSAHSVHQVPGLQQPVEFDLERDESNGTQRLFALAGPFLDALDHGSTVVVDELECSMHPLLTRKLIELFQSAEMNTKGAQLVFATHASEVMSPDLFRRDQIWLVEKVADGSSQLFSLQDFRTKPRSTEAFRRAYLAGRYGAVPRFGPFFENHEVE